MAHPSVCVYPVSVSVREDSKNMPICLIFENRGIINYLDIIILYVAGTFQTDK